MPTFIGEYDLSIDAKGRFLLPSGFRKQISEGEQAFVIARGFEQCLTFYTMDSWNALSAQINKLNDFNPKVRDFKRLFFNGANMMEADSAGRVLLPKMLLDYAGIKKDIVFASQGTYMEIWDAAIRQAHLAKTAADFSDLGNEVLGGGFISPFENL